MKNFLTGAFSRATRLTREQNLAEATRVLMGALTNGAAAKAPTPPPAAHAEPHPPTFRLRRPLGETVELLRHAGLPGLDPNGGPLVGLRKTPQIDVPPGAAYVSRSYVGAAGARDYKVYAPQNVGDGERPLIVMLHGCTQNPDDFAIGSRMNALAEEHGFLVAYPAQSTTANQMGCWNWFNPADQTRERGEPSLIAGMTRAVMAEWRVDATRVYVAGLSAGGAMAATMAATYPELYAAVGVHSGLAHGSASDVASAFAAMSGKFERGAARRSLSDGVRTIVFHGDADQKVHPTNGETIIAGARLDLADALARETRETGSAGGRKYSRTVIADTRGVPLLEHWAVEGLGHAWSGGDPDGSFADRHGPEASREMVRFFLADAAKAR
ncbi:PHB depolymerase family esterase [Methylocystis sp. SC2]|uniref:extracellular catalytic domain type 1 short-chain-length polyhydroxyalkanoate depolymerase n=1 Tax=Methylocystis sp. (strain SC2) TaxID=187303 RepID=UPI00027AECED|nr:PHB depolymerase family esterase [Methylocystis sp. SC2]CCJ08713.1 Esterase, PHB depolymerase family [Methylocystis sp. SC2]